MNVAHHRTPGGRIPVIALIVQDVANVLPGTKASVLAEQALRGFP